MSNHHEKNGDDKTDQFLSSMTFATPGMIQRSQCDCDECGLIPLDLLAAIRKRKRIRLETTPLRRTQDRRLIVREKGLSLWNLTMPMNAEPLVEFGSSHRFMWVKQLPESSLIKSIGTGIIGSSDEQSDRKPLHDWKEGMVYLVPSNGGKAVGWVHSKAASTATSTTASSSSGDVDDSKSETTTSNPTSSSSGGGHAVMYVLKIPNSDEVFSNMQTQSQRDNHSDAADDESSLSWIDIALSILEKLQDERTNQGDDDKRVYYKLSKEDSQTLKEALKDILTAHGSNN